MRRAVKAPGSGDALRYMLLDSPAGEILLAADSRALVHVSFQRGKHPVRPAPTWRWGGPLVAAAAGELREYFAGRRRSFDLPLHLRGTPFQLAAFRALLEIPYGETRSYAEQARAAGYPGAARAAGAANAHNPLAIVVPCHRVIGSDGALTGFGGGLEVKQYLLELERRVLAETERRGAERLAGRPGSGCGAPSPAHRFPRT